MGTRDQTDSSRGSDSSQTGDRRRRRATLDRRDLLRLVPAAAATGLAGCSQVGDVLDGGDPTTTYGYGGTPTAAPTATSTAPTTGTRGATGTRERTATPTSDPAGTPTTTPKAADDYGEQGYGQYGYGGTR